MGKYSPQRGARLDNSEIVQAWQEQGLEVKHERRDFNELKAQARESRNFTESWAWIYQNRGCAE
jgi:hypothetical protein